MGTRLRLIWVSASAGLDDRERRILGLLEGQAPVIIDLSDPNATLPEAGTGDLVIFNVPALDEESIRLIEVVQAQSPGSRILLRTREVSDQILVRLHHPTLLDMEEGPELTRSRIIRALADQRASSGGREAVPEWRKMLIGESRAIQKVAEVIRLVGPRRCTVLITGETGTGKEVVARCIHQAGPRSAGHFVALNCSAVPAALLEAELFGHTRGAFTGATQVRTGRFEQANGGTLFLDEISDLPLELQAKLLRVLQERELQKLGSSETIKVDARVLAATNCDLLRKVREGSFREDLYYRLNVVPLEIPPLRLRKSDVRPLAEHFLRRVCAEEDIPLISLLPDAWSLLETYDWPGNVRQLENTISSAVILSGNRPVMDAGDFSLPPVERNRGAMETLDTFSMPDYASIPDNGIDFTETVNTLERNLLVMALKKTKGNKKAAAEMLGLKRTTLAAKVRVLELIKGAA